MNKNSKIYIPGHNGLVGSAISRDLSKKGYTNQIYSPFPPFDLTKQDIVGDFFEKEKPEYVFLAAAKVGGILSNNTYRAQFLFENLMIESNIIHQSYKYGVKKLLFLGSSCIYPGNCPQPIKEEYLLTGELEYTNEPYAIAKIAGIKMCESYNIQYGTNFISVMPTNLYGPNDNYNLETSHVLPALVRKMHLGKSLENNDWEAIRKDFNKYPVEGINGSAADTEILDKLSKYGISTTLHPAPSAQHQAFSNQQPAPSTQHPVTISLWGTGNPYREFLYVDDLADACVFLMENTDFKDLILENNKIINTHINIGTGRDLTIKDLANLVKDTVGFKGQLKWDSSKPDGTYRKLLDVSKIKKLGWAETVNLKDGIKIIYEKYSSQLL
jgi:GDP-L-fucose synthase